MRFRNPLFGILSFVVAGLLLHIFKETSWAIFVERLLEESAHSLGIPRAAMVATLSQILLGGGMVWATLYFAFRVGRAERPMPPDPAVEAARAHTEALREQTAAFLKGAKAPQAAEPTAGGTIVLAGIVNVLMERALQYGFKMSGLQPEDPFIQLYQDVKNSIDPVWTDEETSRLRTDFLQYCAIVGSDATDRKEMESDRAELRNFGKNLIAKLKGPSVAPPKDQGDWKSAPEAVEVFAESTLLAERDKQGGHLEKALLRRLDAEDKISAILKELPNHKAVEGTEEFKQIEQQNWQIRANTSLEKITEPYVRRAWDNLREDIHKKLANGRLIAKGFREPHVSGNSEVEISSAEWRILTLDNVNSTALRNGEVAYSGLVIRSA